MNLTLSMMATLKHLTQNMFLILWMMVTSAPPRITANQVRLKHSYACSLINYLGHMSLICILICSILSSQNSRYSFNQTQ